MQHVLIPLFAASRILIHVTFFHVFCRISCHSSEHRSTILSSVCLHRTRTENIAHTWDTGARIVDDMNKQVTVPASATRRHRKLRSRRNSDSERHLHKDSHGISSPVRLSGGDAESILDVTHRNASTGGIGTGANSCTRRCRCRINRIGIFRRTLKAFIVVVSPSRDSAISSPGLLRLPAKKEEGSTNDWSACIQYRHRRDNSRGQFPSGDISGRLPSACLHLPLPRLYRECIEAMKKKACRRQSSGSSRCCFTFSPFSLPLVSLPVYYNNLRTWVLGCESVLFAINQD